MSTEDESAYLAGVGAGNAFGDRQSGNYSTTHLPKYWLEISRAIEQAGRASKALRGS
jgi:hypothetical protein